METYIVAVKRQARDQVEDNWADVIEEMDGVELQPDAVNPNRRQVQATEEGIQTLRETLEATHHIEELVMHQAAPPRSPGIEV